MAKTKHSETLERRRRKAVRVGKQRCTADPKALTAKEWRDWVREIRRNVRQEGRKTTQEEMLVLFTQFSLFPTSAQRDKVAKTAEKLRRGLTPAHSPEVLHARMTW